MNRKEQLMSSEKAQESAVQEIKRGPCFKEKGSVVAGATEKSSEMKILYLGMWRRAAPLVVSFQWQPWMPH
jgi:hypothetical protein